MKKKLLLGGALALCIAFSALAAKIVSDPCKECKVSVDNQGAVSFTCGNCGGNDFSLRPEHFGENETTYCITCTGCNHSLTFSTETK